MKFSSIALTLLLSSNANAFVPNFGQKGLFKTNLSSTAVTKEAHFEAVKKNLQDKLQAQEAIPEALKPSLDYFVNEYMTACLNQNINTNVFSERNCRVLFRSTEL